VDCSAGSLEQLRREGLVRPGELAEPIMTIGCAGKSQSLLRSGLRLACAGFGLLAWHVMPVAAATPSFNLTVDADLRFGSFVVVSTGARVVSANGTVTNIGIFPIASGATGPAQFTVAYDRGNNGNKALDLSIELFMGNVPTVGSGGVTGRLSGFTTDMAGVPTLQTGQIVPIAITGCVSRICSRTFRIGSRLDVSRSGTGRTIAIPIPITATLVNVR
jgi:hypothetical protein